MTETWQLHYAPSQSFSIHDTAGSSYVLMAMAETSPRWMKAPWPSSPHLRSRPRFSLQTKPTTAAQTFGSWNPVSPHLRGRGAKWGANATFTLTESSSVHVTGLFAFWKSCGHSLDFLIILCSPSQAQPFCNAWNEINELATRQNKFSAQVITHG